MKLFTLRLRTLLPFLLLLAGPAWAQQPTWQWVSTQTSASTGTSTCFLPLLDGSGGIVVGGIFTGTITLGGTTLVSAGNNDAFMGRLSPAGAWTQVVAFGGTGDDYLDGLALDGSGGVVVVGNFTSPTLTLGANTLQNADASGRSSDILVARLSAAGIWTQVVRAGGNNSDAPRAVAVEANGTVVVAGNFRSSSIAFGATTLANGSVVPFKDLFVARLSVAGTWTQAVRAGGTNDDDPRSLAVDAAGTVTLVGTGDNQPGNFGNAPIINANPVLGNDGIFVARLNPTGTWTQVVVASGAASSYPIHLALDSAGNAILAGTFVGPTIRFGPFQLAHFGNGITTSDYDIFLARLSPAGSWTQAVAVGGAGSDTVGHMVADANGTATVVGTFTSSQLAFGATTLANAGSATSDIFLARLSATGSWTQALRVGGSGSDVSAGVALDGPNSVIIAGRVDSPSATFGSLSTATVTPSAFVARLTGLATATRTAAPDEVFTLAPNPAGHGPATAHVRLSWPEAPATARPLLVLDNLGHTVRRQELPARATTATLDVLGLPPGLYLVRCGAATARLVVE